MSLRGSLPHVSAAKELDDEADRSARTNQAGVTAYLLYNGSATYVVWRA